MNFLETQAPRLLPELTLLAGALLCLLTGLSPKAEIRRLTSTLALFSAVLATLLVAMPLPEKASWTSPVGLHNLPAFLKGLIGVLGALLLMVGAKVPDRLRQVLGAETAKPFDAGSDYRGEFFAFTLVSMAGAMLCAGAGDLVWLLLALELVSLPSYVMIACSRDSQKAQESAIKYFFLGAMAAAVFLFGFALMYGATGSTDLVVIRDYVQSHDHGVPSHLMITGVVLAVTGIAFKIAAAPMHAYTQDVYEGAATPVTAFLAIIPKIAGFAALILVLGTVGWYPGKNGVSPLPDVLIALLSLMAVASMLVGNTLGVLAKTPKRMMGCSSVAQSGYLLLALLAGPTLYTGASEIQVAPDASVVERVSALFAGGTEVFNQTSGIGALCLYLTAYAMGTIAVLAALGCLVDKHGHDADSWHDLSGLRRRHPMLACIIALGALSLMGLPLLGGFTGKLVLANATLSSGASKLGVALVVLLVVNSAISAVYYLRLTYSVLLGADNCPLIELPVPTRRTAALVAALATLALGGLLAQPLLKIVNKAAGMPAVENAAAAGIDER